MEKNDPRREDVEDIAIGLYKDKGDGRHYLDAPSPDMSPEDHMKRSKAIVDCTGLFGKYSGGNTQLQQAFYEGLMAVYEQNREILSRLEKL